jgi:tRNA-dihydrouridine synthase
MTLNEEVDLARLQFRKSLEVKGIPRGIFEMRRHFINYFKGLPDFRDIRMKLVTTLDIEEIEKLLDLILISYPKH